MQRGRVLFVAFLVLYAVSTLLVLIASAAKGPLPAWGGYLDTAIATLIAVSGFLIFGMNKTKPSKYETSHRVALYILPIALLGMWVFRNTLDFNILLPGLTWRIFFFLHILPYGLNIWNPESIHE